MKEVIFSQYKYHKAGINSLKAPGMVLTRDFQPIHRQLEFNKYLRDGIRQFEKIYIWGWMDNFRRVFLQPRYVSTNKELIAVI